MKKKVLFVVHHLTIGGAQKSLITALKYFDYEKYNVTLYVRKNRLDLIDYIDNRVNIIINEDNHSYYRKPYAVLLQLLIVLSGIIGKKEQKRKYEEKLSRFILTKPMEYEQKKYFKDKKYDIAIAFMHGSSALFVSDYTDSHKKVVRYCVSTDENHEIHEKVFNITDSIICVSDGVKEAVASFYPENIGKIRVIENIVDKEYVLKSADEFNVDRTDSELILCSVGRFSEVKGMDFALEASKLLRDKGVNFRWFLIGDGPEMDKLNALTQKYNLEKNIVFTGMINNPYPYLKACDIFILPSRAEALSNALLEAYALRKPVVCTSTVCGLNNVTDGETGVLTDISPEGIADGVMKLIEDNGLCNKIIDNLSKIDFDKLVTRYRGQWHNVLEEL